MEVCLVDVFTVSHAFRESISKTLPTVTLIKRQQFQRTPLTDLLIVLFFGCSDLAHHDVIDRLPLKEVGERHPQSAEDILRLAAMRHALDEDSLAAFGDGERGLAVGMGRALCCPLAAPYSASMK